MTFAKEFELKDGTCIEVEFDGYYKFYSGVYSGPPENCYPDEEEWEITNSKITYQELSADQIVELDNTIDDFCDSDECREILMKGDE